MGITKAQAKAKALETFMRLADGAGQEALYAAHALLNYASPPQYPNYPPPLPPDATGAAKDAAPDGGEG